MTFAERLRGLRDKTGLTQEQLAKASGIPIWTVRNYEQGRREPNWMGAIQLARALGTTCEAFAECEDVGATEAPPAEASAPSTPPAADLQAEAVKHPAQRYRLEKPPAPKKPARRKKKGE